MTPAKIAVDARTATWRVMQAQEVFWPSRRQMVETLSIILDDLSDGSAVLLTMETIRVSSSDLPASDEGQQVQQEPPTFRPLVQEPNPFRPGPGWFLGPGRQVPLTGFPSEADMAQAVLSRLEPWFHVETEVRGRHPLGSTCRIDAVLTPRTPQQWKRADIALAVEFKALAAREAPGRTDVTAWIAQAIDYSYVHWGDFGRLPVFLCPSPFAEQHLYSVQASPVEIFASGLLGQYGVGFLSLYEGTGLTFMTQGRHRIWSERYGTEQGRRWALRPRVGHRR